MFASETKDDDVRDEISMFDVTDDCPILNQELVYHVTEDDDEERRSVYKSCNYITLYFNYITYYKLLINGLVHPKKSILSLITHL